MLKILLGCLFARIKFNTCVVNSRGKRKFINPVPLGFIKNVKNSLKTMKLLRATGQEKNCHFLLN